MADETERSEPTSTLPQPELNPLLNPVLGQNMGRWAEVYFTAPPERREQAVAELLQELKAGPTEERSTEKRTTEGQPAPSSQASSQHRAQSPSFEAQPQSKERLISPTAPAPLPTDIPWDLVCQACGFSNPADQRFCGMCGSRLASGGPSAPLQDQVPAEPTPPQSNANSATERPHDDFPWREKFASARESAESRSLSFRGFYPVTESAPYRGYIVMAVLIGVVTLGYMTWRSFKSGGWPATLMTSSRPAPAEPAAPSSTAGVPPVSSVPDKIEPPSSPQRAAAATRAVPEKVTNDAPHEAPKAAKAPLIAHAAAPQAPTPVAASSSVSDVIMAQNLLNGSNGYQRNSVEAADWLWKAVSKQNAYAAYLLSDLYLKGDGVSKNCDQARVLLDAAASKGVTQAGTRLRNMQAFGCQ